MNYPKHLIAFILIFLVISCTEENITNQSNLGNINGRVGYETGSGFMPLEDVIVSIPGTSIEVQTDSAGNYFMLNLPAGEYNLHVYYYGNTKNIYDVSVGAGHTTKVSDIIFNFSNPIYSGFLGSVSIRLPDYGYVYLYQDDTTFVNTNLNIGDSLMLSAELNDSYYQKPFPDTSLTIKYGSDLFYMETIKGVLQMLLPIRESFSQIRIWEGHSVEPQNGEFKSTFYATPMIDIRVDLDWSTSYGYSAGDCDIHLISVGEQDSCWYKNPHPDWGFKGYSYDDPRLYDQTNTSGSYYADEVLYLDFIPDGSYILKIVYFSNLFNPSQAITAEITLRIDNNYYYYYVPVGMSVGQVWTVLKLDIPSKTITEINTVEGPIKQTAAKEVQ